LTVYKTRQEKLDDYDGFVEKFRPKKTTDDCMTPPAVYEAVAGWVHETYGIDREDMVRPFWPGGDYEAYDYPDGCCVVDNPPFSVLSRIKRFYLDHGIGFFLFCPSLTAISSQQSIDMTAVICDANITYENGAVVRTAFATSLDPENVVVSDPELGKRVNEASATAEKDRGAKKTLPKYSYPPEVLTAAMVQRYAKYDIKYRVRKADCCHIQALDSQRASGKTIFGGGLLLSERAAAERAAAERAAAERAAAERAAAERATATVWELSDREREMSRMLGDHK
jgi:hypothetical protein